MKVKILGGFSMKKKLIFSALLRLVFMKRHSILFVALLVFVTNILFAVELWEGIDTNMTKAQALAKAREVHQVTIQAEEQSGRSTEELFFEFDELRVNRNDLPNRIYPQNLTTLLLVSPLAQYHQESYFNPNLNQNRHVPNIRLHFSGDKLFGIIIYWAIPHRNVLEMVERKYGRPTETISVTSFMGRNVYTVFETSELIVYCAIITNQHSYMCVISKEALRTL
jgi:hypothetical protein